MSVVPFVAGNRILEIGHGPGHLQKALRSRGLTPIGIDESAQMGRLARRNLTRLVLARIKPKNTSSQSIGYTQINLTRGLAQHLPFASELFNTVVATFPTEYITDPKTLSEIKRCLLPGGRLVVLPVALPRNRFLDWLFKTTHQRPSEATEIIQARLRNPFIAAGFEAEIKTLDISSGILLIVLATKPEQSSMKL